MLKQEDVLTVMKDWALPVEAQWEEVKLSEPTSFDLSLAVFTTLKVVLLLLSALHPTLFPVSLSTCETGVLCQTRPSFSGALTEF